MQEIWQEISVCVITLNEEKNLAACLASVKGCGEIIVVDSGSVDGTQKIAESFGAVWITKPWRGFAQQRREAEQRATKPFVLFLDADEQISEELQKEISILLQDPHASQQLYFFLRKSEFLGRRIHYGDWKKDWVARLAPRGKTEWVGREPHPYLQGIGLENYFCQNFLFHWPYENISTFTQKSELYARTWAQEAYQAKVRGGKITGGLRAGWRWVRGYLFKGGFLDGYPGWLIAKQNARMVWLKYLFLSELYRKTHS